MWVDWGLLAGLCWAFRHAFLLTLALAFFREARCWSRRRNVSMACVEKYACVAAYYIIIMVPGLRIYRPDVGGGGGGGGGGVITRSVV
jgi:hypothetical protein